MNGSNCRLLGGDSRRGMTQVGKYGAQESHQADKHSEAVKRCHPRIFRLAGRLSVHDKQTMFIKPIHASWVIGIDFDQFCRLYDSFIGFTRT